MIDIREVAAAAECIGIKKIGGANQSNCTFFIQWLENVQCPPLQACAIWTIALDRRGDHLLDVAECNQYQCFTHASEIDAPIPIKLVEGFAIAHDRTGYQLREKMR